MPSISGHPPLHNLSGCYWRRQFTGPGPLSPLESSTEAGEARDRMTHSIVLDDFKHPRFGREIIGPGAKARELAPRPSNYLHDRLQLPSTCRRDRIWKVYKYKMAALTEYELQREQRIAENRRRMEELGLIKVFTPFCLRQELQHPASGTFASS